MLPLIIKSPDLIAKERTYSIGLDGCRGGWVATSINNKGEVSVDHVKELSSYLSSQPKEAVILADMMLNLDNSGEPRRFDCHTRKLLGKWHSRCFTAPPKKALEAEDYRAACEISFSICGKKISKQCYNLFPKIRELALLKDNRLIEFHPEIAFMLLNENHLIQESKKTSEGINIRMALLQKIIPGFSSLTEHIDSSNAKVDDLLDSAALAVVAKGGSYKNFMDDLNKVQINQDFPRA